MLYEELASIVGVANVMDDQATLSAYAQDVSPFPPISPSIVVRPGTIGEISEIMKLATKAKSPIITRGVGTSFTGFLDSSPGRSIILETRRMNRILEIDKENMTVTAECGALMSELEDAVMGRGLYVHTVTVPVRFSTLGGVLSGVVGGGLPVRGAVAGTDANQLLGLKVVLADGRIVSTNAGGSNVNAKRDYVRGGNGPDLTGIFVGDGGYFGVKVEATLKIFPQPNLTATGSWVFSDFEKAWSAMNSLMKMHTTPYSQLKVRYMTDYSLMYEAVGENQSELESKIAAINRACKENGGKEAPEDLKQFSSKFNDYMRDEERVKAPQGMTAYIIGKKEFPHAYMEIKQLIERRVAERRLGELGVSSVSTFRPNELTSVYANIAIRYDPSRPQSRSEVLSLYKECYAKIVELGGSPEPHQGFGSIVQSAAWSPEYRKVVMEMKKILDPSGVLNPAVWAL